MKGLKLSIYHVKLGDMFGPERSGKVFYSPIIWKIPNEDAYVVCLCQSYLIVHRSMIHENVNINSSI